MHTAPVALQRSRHGSRGFTLIELMVTMALGVVLMVVAVPSFVQFRKNADLSEAVSSFMMASGAAKSAALKTGRNVFIQVNVAATGWKSGWFVFVDNNWDNDYDEGTDEVVLRHEALSPELATSTPAPSGTVTTFPDGYVLFNGSGYPRTKAGAVISLDTRLVISTTGRGSNIYIDTTGRVRSCRTGVDTGCPA